MERRKLKVLSRKLREAADLLASKKWCKGNNALDDDGKYVHPHSSRASCMCAEGAFIACYPNGTQGLQALNDLELISNECDLPPEGRVEYFKNSTGFCFELCRFNDHAKSKRAVVNVMRRFAVEIDRLLEG